MPAKKLQEKTMNKSDLRDLHAFVKDGQAAAVADAANANTENPLTEQQVRTIILAVQGKTDECFFRFMDRL